MAGEVPARVEVPLALGLIALAGLVLVESRHIPPTVFDALGSAAVPRGVAVLIALLSLVVLGRCRGRAGDAAAGVSLARRVDAVAVLLLTALFVAAMQEELLGFGWLATAYLIASIGWLERLALRRLPATVVLAAVVGFGLQYVFTRIFIVNLPGL